MPAALRHRRGSLTMIFMPITWSVYRQRADAIVAAEAAGVLRGK
jgi:cbb3-type cytochrome oxidase subunit 3